MKVMQKQGARRCLALVLLLAVLLPQLTHRSARAAEGDTVALQSVTVAGQSYTVPENWDSITLADSVGRTPTFELTFSHNVQNETYLQANLDKISVINAETGDVQTVIKSEGTSGSNSQRVLLVQATGLADGKYMLTVDSGVETNSGATLLFYTVNFTVGADTALGEGGDEDGHTVTFDVSGVVDTPWEVLVRRQSGQTCTPVGDGIYQLADGNYTYVVSANGYATQQGSFTVSGEDRTVSVAMADRVYVTIEVTPAEATVRLKYGQEDYIADYTVAGSAWTFCVRPDIEYTYVVEAPGYTTKSSRFTPIGDETRTIDLDPAEETDGYTWQGNGGNTLLMTAPSAEQIEVKEETDTYYYNVISGDYSFKAAEEINFAFTMSAGINAFGDGAHFLEYCMDLIAVYPAFEDGQPVGEPLAQYSGGTGEMRYRGFADRIITIGMDPDVLSGGTYVLVFGQNVCGNNANKTIGKKIVFEFTVLDDSPPAPGAPGSDNTGTGDDGAPAVPPPQADGDTGGQRGTALPFADVAENDWFYSAVAYAYENGIMNGVSADAFAPALTTSRSMIVTVLYRLEGQPAVTGGASFTDVPADTWYTDAVLWASANGIVNGVGNGAFDPDGDITREQMAAMLYRYARYKGADVSAQGDLSGFADGGDVSDWAVYEMQWAVGAGILQGDESGFALPGGYALRSQAAAMLMRFCENILQ